MSNKDGKLRQKVTVGSTTVWASLKGHARRDSGSTRLTQDPPLREPNRKDGRPNCFHWESRASGKGDTPQQVLETRVVAQTVHAGIDMKIDEPVRALFVGFLEVFDRAVVFSQTDVDSREEVW
jgi:hypothetical protein